MAKSGQNTSFQKTTRQKSQLISGTRLSLHNSQLLLSTGVQSLDNCLGGGLPVGTVLLIEEDFAGYYSKLLTKYFLAEGILSNHEIYVACADEPQLHLLKELPSPVIDEITANIEAIEHEDMKIAWRYHSLPQVQTSVGANALRFGHNYDLTKTMDEAIVSDAKKNLFFPSESNCIGSQCTCNGQWMSPCYSELLANIKLHIDSGGFGTSELRPQQNLLRIAIVSLASPLWPTNNCQIHNSQLDEVSLCRFLFGLRSLMRTSYGSAIITMPVHLLQGISTIGRFEHLCDVVVHLESFAGSEKESNPAFKEYHGLFHMKKLPCLNSMTSHTLDTLDLAFKLRRKRFTIERLCLPAELAEGASRPQEDPVFPSGTMCGGGYGGKKNKLDF